MKRFSRTWDNVLENIGFSVFPSPWTPISLATLTLLQLDGLNPSQRVVLLVPCHSPTSADSYHPERSFLAQGRYQSCCLIRIYSRLIRPLDLEWLIIRGLKMDAITGFLSRTAAIRACFLALALWSPIADSVEDLPEKDPNHHHHHLRVLGLLLISSMDTTLLLLDRPTTETRMTERKISSTCSLARLLRLLPAPPVGTTLRPPDRLLSVKLCSGLAVGRRAVLLRRLSTTHPR